MLYHKNILLFISANLIAAFLVVRYVITMCTMVGIICLQWLLRMNVFPNGAMASIIGKMQWVHGEAIVWANNILAWIVVEIMILIMWFVINVCTGQLIRDVKSAQLKKQLTKIVGNEISENVILSKKVNQMIRKLRIIKLRGKLLVVIPAGNTLEIANNIESRWDNGGVEWLENYFKNKKWRPIKRVHKFFRNYEVIREK
ncbi:hypothetical protein ACLHIM_07065 [Ligilactobacillus sp. LYQ112]|uniref:hypothetical protein n=1 Tax=Ligilactobacillus sp. LYQ112 TaxID=3391060 RepID=UPI003982F9E1